MTRAGPPAADDEDAYVFFDHREEEGSIIDNVSQHLAPEHALSVRAEGLELFVTHRGMEHKIPLTISGHDRYVAVSSLAELLKDDYRFFVRVPSLDTDTHAVLVVPAAEAAGWGSLPEHLEPLRLGFDYFSGISVPYLNHEDSAPNFAVDSEARRESGLAAAQLMEVFFTSKSVPGAAAQFAKAAMLDPTLREFLDWPENATEAEIAALYEKAISEAMQDPEVKEARGEFDGAMQELWKLTGGPPKKS